MTTEARRPLHSRISWWMRDSMGLRELTAESPAPAGLRCDLHGVGHGRGALAARLGGGLLVVASLFSIMIGARPAEAREAGERSTAATTVGAGLGVLGVGGFVAGSVIERRTRYHVWLQCESRAITRADVGELLTSGEAARGRVDSAWQPDQLWLVGAAADEGVAAFARDRGVRCFVAQGSNVREL